MDQQFENRPVSNPGLANPGNESKSGSKKLAPILVAISIIAVGALGLAAMNMVMLEKKTSKADLTAQSEAYEKRLKDLEEASKFTENQVDTSRYQAVFLESGQVYFGKITEVKQDTMKLEDIYYLRSGTVDKSGNPTPGTDMALVKLGNELHAPEDVMLIERKNLSFWENLKKDGQVSKAIDTYKIENPKQ